MKLHSKIPAVAEKARNNFTPVLFAASGMRHNVTLAHLQGYLTLLRTVSVRRPNSLFFTVCDLQRIRPSFAYLTGKKVSAKSRTARYRPNRERKMYDFVITQRNSLRQNAHAPASKQNVLLSSSENDTKKPVMHVTVLFHGSVVHTNSIEIVRRCRRRFCFDLSSVTLVFRILRTF